MHLSLDLTDPTKYAKYAPVLIALALALDPTLSAPGQTISGGTELTVTPEPEAKKAPAKRASRSAKDTTVADADPFAEDAAGDDTDPFADDAPAKADKPKVWKMEELRAAVRPYYEKDGPGFKKVLAKFGADSLAKLDKANYTAFYEALTA